MLNSIDTIKYKYNPHMANRNPPHGHLHILIHLWPRKKPIHDNHKKKKKKDCDAQQLIA
jgi:hypothetical protein